jgi:hypothetical protein
MRSIGIRVEPQCVTFAVYDSGKAEIINIEKLNVPKALEGPEQLKFIRSNMLDIFREYGIQHAGIRITEPNSRHLSIARLQIEGVIQEAIASSCVVSYYTGQISNISARLGLERTDFKKLIEGDKDYEIESWSELAKPEKEAVLAAIGAAK